MFSSRVLCIAATVALLTTLVPAQQVGMSVVEVGDVVEVYRHRQCVTYDENWRCTHSAEIGERGVVCEVSHPVAPNQDWISIMFDSAGQQKLGVQRINSPWTDQYLKFVSKSPRDGDTVEFLYQSQRVTGTITSITASSNQCQITMPDGKSVDSVKLSSVATLQEAGWTRVATRGWCNEGFLGERKASSLTDCQHFCSGNDKCKYASYMARSSGWWDRGRLHRWCMVYSACKPADMAGLSYAHGSQYDTLVKEAKSEIALDKMVFVGNGCCRMEFRDWDATKSIMDKEDTTEDSCKTTCLEDTDCAFADVVLPSDSTGDSMLCRHFKSTDGKKGRVLQFRLDLDCNDRGAVKFPQCFVKARPGDGRRLSGGDIGLTVVV